MQKLLQDLRYAFRQMARTPGFTLAAILSLALGIGATVSVFSVIYSAILNAWPYAEFRSRLPDQHHQQDRNENRPDSPAPRYADCARRRRSRTRSPRTAGTSSSPGTTCRKT